MQITTAIWLLARFRSCWQDWTYLGDDQYNSVTGYYTMDTIEYCDSLSHGHFLQYNSLSQWQMEFERVEQARILLCIGTFCPKYTYSQQSHSCIKLTTSRCLDFLTLLHILQFIYGLPFAADMDCFVPSSPASQPLFLTSHQSWLPWLLTCISVQSSSPILAPNFVSMQPVLYCQGIACHGLVHVWKPMNSCTINFRSYPRWQCIVRRDLDTKTDY